MRLPSRRVSGVSTPTSADPDSGRGAVRRLGPRRFVAVALTAILVVGAAVLLRPADLGALTSTAHPTAGYDQALAALQTLESRDGADVNPVCRSGATLHGRRTAKAIVLLHGFTSCPAMWRVLAAQFYERGYNVITVRLPHHGLQDRLTEDLEKLTAGELIQAGDEAVDIANGFGDEVVVAGISAGGVLTAWLAENRAIAEGVVINPALTAPHALGVFALPIANALLTAPNQFLWWNSSAKAAIQGPPYAYPRFPTHALGEVFRLGLSVSSGSHLKPRAQRLVVITTEDDPGTSNEFTGEVVDAWRSSGAVVVTYSFPKSEISFHDILSPEQPYQKIDLVYPRVLALADP